MCDESSLKVWWSSFESYADRNHRVRSVQTVSDEEWTHRYDLLWKKKIKQLVWNNFTFPSWVTLSRTLKTETKNSERNDFQTVCCCWTQIWSPVEDPSWTSRLSLHAAHKEIPLTSGICLSEPPFPHQKTRQEAQQFSPLYGAMLLDAAVLRHHSAGETWSHSHTEPNCYSKIFFI